MRDVSDIVKERQSAMRAALEECGMSFKVIASNSGIPYTTLLSYFPDARANAEPAMMPVSALVKLIGIVPEKIISLSLPDTHQVLRVPAGVDHDEFEMGCRDYLATKGMAHRPDSPAGRDISACEDDALRVARLRVVGA